MPEHAMLRQAEGGGERGNAFPPPQGEPWPSTYKQFVVDLGLCK